MEIAAMDHGTLKSSVMKLFCCIRCTMNELHVRVSVSVSVSHSLDPPSLPRRSPLWSRQYSPNWPFRSTVHAPMSHSLQLLLEYHGTKLPGLVVGAVVKVVAGAVHLNDFTICLLDYHNWRPPPDHGEASCQHTLHPCPPEYEAHPCAASIIW